VDLRRLIAIIRTWFPLLVASVVLAAAAAYVVSNLQEKTYESKATLIVGQSLTGVNPDYTQLLVSQRLSTTYATVATTRPVLAAVIEKLGLDASPDDLRKNVAAEAPIDSTLVTVNAQATDPEQAAAIANALSEELIAASPAIQGRQAELQASIDADLTATQAQITTTQARIAELAALTKRTAAQETELTTLEGRLVTLRSTYATLLSSASGNASNLLSVVEPAVASPDPVAPRPLLNTLLAAVLGLMIAIGIITAAEYLRDAVKDPEDVQEVTGLSTLGIIARMKGDGGRSEIYQLAALLYPRSSVTEAYRTLRTNVEFASVDTPVQTLLVTSSMPGESCRRVRPGWQARSPRGRGPEAAGHPPRLRPAQRARVDVAPAAGRREPRRSRPGNRAGQPPRPDDRAASAQPRRAARLTPDAGDGRPVQG
jgi:succinoglycan biosynthesis transport protein ExoP